MYEGPSMDDDCLVNLIDHEDHESALGKLRSQLTAELARVNDPVAPILTAVDDESLRKAFMAAEDERSAKAKKARQKQNARPKKKASAGTRKPRNAK